MHDYQQLVDQMEDQRALDAPVALYEPGVAPVVQPSAVWPSAVPWSPSKPRVDPLAQRLAGGGVLLAGAGAAGWGLSFMFTAMAQATTALGLVLGILAVVAYLRSSGSRGGGGPVNVNVRTEVSQRNG